MATKFTKFDSTRYLDNEETIATYLEAILEEKDAGLLAEALGKIAKARGMSEIAQSSGMTREALYKALRVDAQPRFETISQVLNAIGLRLTIEPLKKKTRAPAASKSGKAKSTRASLHTSK
ncbi:addiction module antidote protein [Dyella mobilis]|uniref:Addiction module antidote protein n=1 Tax=Dyella mobilis TaxID=1849582 RepID=A0ABS2KJ64_9GAMM|nr:addiction module antidote protein [Dyella mobilis]MBM7131222.1 putative addiction module antidote protein [Dyella mobilis]GLQ98841.1 transcriptional regulator [Dyella mobilis]